MIKLNRAVKDHKILVVEDDRLAQAIIISRLKHLPCDITTAFTGHDALKEVSSDYDLVLINVDLHDIKGVEVCRRIRQKGLKDISILMITTSSCRWKKEALAAGANQFLIQPFNQYGLDQVIQQFFHMEKKSNENANSSK